MSLNHIYVSFLILIALALFSSTGAFWGATNQNRGIPKEDADSSLTSHREGRFRRPFDCFRKHIRVHRLAG